MGVIVRVGLEKTLKDENGERIEPYEDNKYMNFTIRDIKVCECGAKHLLRGTCTTPWHASCLSSPPETLASTLLWECPDCSDLMAAIHAIGADATLTDAAEKAKKMQESVWRKKRTMMRESEMMMSWPRSEKT
ncbi:unnamed protein product [Microthlaspi erraticum]|uniref:Zinc finger PHD-type domain-containing protein n=1 Tax=Microthlaspi erraticum TaxID=1685480 RepID=A0A6D2HFD7_9BRAS|nr:unnamed protein product [Microthlaspi erraticum]